MSEQKVSEMVSNWRTEVRRGALQLYLLSLIRKNHEMYGYQIVKELKEKTAPIFEIKEGVLYPILRRLEKDKILESTWRTPMNG
ncbi:MAG: PadR family transcriptional regulator, partial [Candidatus Heimdallarchaeota archaeon]